MKILLTLMLSCAANLLIDFIASAAPIGGDAGEPYDLVCPNNTYAIGVRVQHDNNVITRLSLQCAAVDLESRRAILRTARWIGPSPSNGSKNDVLIADEYTCPNGSILTPEIGAFTENHWVWTVLSGLELRCDRYTRGGQSNRRELIGSRNIGPKVKNRINPSRVFLSSLSTAGIGLGGIALKTGYGVDSLDVIGRDLPWTALEEINEDCTRINTQALGVRNLRGRWVVTNGQGALTSSTRQANARKVVDIIEHYGANLRCFVGRPDPSMSYLRASGNAPRGSFRGEDCQPFMSDRLRIGRRGGRVLLLGAKGRGLFAFPNQREAQTAIKIINKYEFTYSCYVGRPNPEFQYLRKYNTGF